MTFPLRSLLPLFTLLFFAAGCGSSGGSSGRARPSLTDATDEAKKDPDDQEAVRVKKEKEEMPEQEPAHVQEPVVVYEPTETTAVVEDHDAATTEPPAESTGRFRAGAFVSGAGFASGPVQSYRSVGAFGGIRDGRGSADLRVGVFVPHLRSTSGLDEALKDEFGMNFEGQLRYHLTADQALMDVGLAGALRLGFLDWGYENPITVDNGDGNVETFEGDTIGFVTLLAGVAFTPVQSGNFLLAFSLLGGGQIYSANTLNGFENDLMEDSWMAELSLDIGYIEGKEPSIGD